MFNNKTITSITRKSLNDGASDFWTVVASLSEYTYTPTDLTAKPIAVYDAGVLMTEGTQESLAAGQWVWVPGDPSFLQVRVSGSVDPDTLDADTIMCLPEYTKLCEANDNYALNGESFVIEIQVTNNSAVDVAGEFILEDSTGVEKHTIKFECSLAEGTIQQSMKLFLNEGDILRVKANTQDISVFVAGDGLV